MNEDSALKERVTVPSESNIWERKQEEPKIKEVKSDDKKVTLDDIDKRLDEIMGNL